MSNTVCDANSRASNRLNGPTTLGKPGPSGNPNASRLFFRLDSVMEADTSGSNRLNALHRSPRAVSVFCSDSSTPRLCSRARKIASTAVSRIGSAVTVPVGTPPINGLRSGTEGPERICAAAGDAAISSAATAVTRTGRNGILVRCRIVKCTSGKTSDAGLRVKKILHYHITIHVNTSVHPQGTSHGARWKEDGNQNLYRAADEARGYPPRDPVLPRRAAVAAPRPDHGSAQGHDADRADRRRPKPRAGGRPRHRTVGRHPAGGSISRTETGPARRRPR